VDTLTAIAPALIALVCIIITRRAALSLFVAVCGGVLIIKDWNVLDASRALFVEVIFKTLEGDWHVGPLLFTLLLGSFAVVLEKSGGFQQLLGRVSSSSDGGQKKSLFSVFGLGLLCFFDGLGNAILVGRVARPVTDAVRASRQMLAYLIDSTSSAVACIAFISTWIATQLSLIKSGLEGAPFEVNPTSLYFQSIPANPYCWLTIVMIAVVIARSWWIGPMKRYQIEAAEKEGEEVDAAPVGGSLKSVLVPLVVLLVSVPGFIYIWQDGEVWSWKEAFKGSHVPHAMVAAGFVGLIAACVMFPKGRKHELLKHVTDGGAAMLPALVILIFAWSLGSVFSKLETAKVLSGMLQGGVTLAWFPLMVFAVAALTSWLTGSSWGTMGILMPIALPITLQLGADVSLLMDTVPLVIGAVFGGAVFGDHCSPFSDTTIVSSIAAECSAESHVITQTPYAFVTVLFAFGAYLLMGVGMLSWLATALAAVTLTLVGVVATRMKSI